jgi:hypothetical protein
VDVGRFVRAIFIALVVISGCVADAEEPQPTESAQHGNLIHLGTVDERDVCALAAALPADDICSLVCDPAAMEARMIADGNDTGACYQLYCSLTASDSVLVGVCLP